MLRSHQWRTAANSAAYLLGELRPGQTVLDVGCGPGTITADLASLVAPGQVTGVDRGATSWSTRPRTPPNAAWTTSGSRSADVHALDFPDDSFDVVHAHQVLQHVSDPVQALREMRRVCRPGGVVAARDSDYAAMTWYPDVPGHATSGRSCTAGWPGPTAASRTPGAGCCPGRGGRAHRHHADGGRLVLRDPGARLVERSVGGPDGRVGVRGTGRGRRARDPGAADGDLGGLARVGRQERRLVHGAARRGALPKGQMISSMDV